jgi:hypothetical protein
MFFFICQLYSYFTSYIYEVLSLCTLSSPSIQNDLKCEERGWEEREEEEEDDSDE